jgi:hypothetical protein
LSLSIRWNIQLDEKMNVFPFATRATEQTEVRRGEDLKSSSGAIAKVLDQANDNLQEKNPQKKENKHA